MLLKSRVCQISGLAADETILQQAWRSVRAAGGGPGVDDQTLEQFSENFPRELLQLHDQLSRGAYRFSRLRSAIIPKQNGKERKLGIPTIRDRAVLQAVKMVIEPACEARFHACSHAYRPKRSAMTALSSIAQGMSRGLQLVLETDIESFFDSIRHRDLLSQLQSMEPRAKNSPLIQASLRLSSGHWPAKKGIAQGSPLSPLLANVSLTSFDSALDRKDWMVIRYADDLVVLCKSSVDAQRALALAKTELAKLGLNMHPEKTRIVDSRVASFHFLGFEFHPDRLAPDADNLAKLRDSVTAWCNPHSGESWETRLQNINALLRSFAWYYHRTDSTRLFWTLDRYVHDCLQELESAIGSADKPWQDQLVQMSRMRGVGWLGKGKQKGSNRSWNGYGS